MFRVTNSMMYNNALTNMYSQNEKLYKTTEQLSSGKRVNTPSDDPLAIGEIMQFETTLARNGRYATFTADAKGYLSTCESQVASATDLGTRAQELAMGQASGTATAQTRLTTSREVDQLLQQAIQIGNGRLGSAYLFGGRQTNQSPVTANGLYSGDNVAVDAAVGESASVTKSIMASEFLNTDMSPIITNTTALSSLRGGQGISLGSFSITDRAGATGNVTVAAGMTVGGLVAAINASGANVTASITQDGRAIQIKDNNTTNVIGATTIANTAGTTASDLGLAGTRTPQTIVSNNLRPAITATTTLGSLYGGAGLTLSNIAVVNGAASATVSFAGATTVGDLITAINASGANVTAAINANGTALSLASNSAATVAFAKDLGAGKTADMIGIGGGRNLILNLQRLSAALKANDVTAITGLTDNLAGSIDTTAAIRGEIGARINRLDTNTSQLDAAKVDTTTMLSNVQDADMAKAASDFALLQTAYQATARATANIIQPSLMDFLR